MAQSALHLDTYTSSVLPDGVRSKLLDINTGLSVHLLEAGEATTNRPLILLLHGFPELAYSWRYVLPALADAGYYVVAPDLRGYGRTTGWDRRYETEIDSFSQLNLVGDCVALVAALGYRQVAAVVGHDFGSPLAAHCALTRADVFASVVMMSAPFAGIPPWPDRSGAGIEAAPSLEDLDGELGELQRARKHYQRYYCTRSANADMMQCSAGLHSFLRAYFHFKSADWHGNTPFRLAGWSAEELAQMPTYYIMDRDWDMAQTVAPYLPDAEHIAQCQWLSEADLAVYSREFGRTGFQGGLQWYRCALSERIGRRMQLYAGRSIDVPSAFIGGASDWGVYQRPGDFEKMQLEVCSDFRRSSLVDGAGHWVQQERADTVNEFLLDFFKEVAPV